MAEPARIGAVRLKPGVYLGDGLANLMTGAGTTADKRMASFYAMSLMDPQQVEAAYRTSWLARKIVDLPAKDMTREWRDWKGDKEAIGQIEAAEKKLKLREHVKRALRFARLGGGAIYIAVDGDDPAQPLDLARIKPDSLSYLVTFTRWQLRLGDRVTDPRDPLVGGPEWFELATNTTTQGARIHPSRMAVFKGAEVPIGVTTAWHDAYWGDPLYMAVGEAIRNADGVQGNFASMIEEAKFDIFGIPNLLANLADPGYENRVGKRLALATQGKGLHRAVIKDSEETWEQHQLTLSGMPELIASFLGIVAGAADIPVTRLLGQSAKGLNATGEGDERDYLSSIASRQDDELRPQLEMIDAVMLRSAGVANPLPWFDFAPLFKMTEKDRAETDYKKAQTAQIYVNSGLVPADALAESVQNMLVEEGTYPGLEEALDALEPTEEPNATDPNAEADTLLPGERVPLKLAANDAAPRTLYVSRRLVNTSEFLAWAKAQGFETTTPAEHLHVTVAFSRQLVDWMKIDGEDWNQKDDGTIEVPPGGVRIVEALGDKSAVVLMFTSSRLSWRHQQILAAGASFDFPDYQPHVTITYQAGDLDLSKVEPYRGKLVFGPEIFQEVQDDWEKSVVEE